jgi:hypothetical protein
MKPYLHKSSGPLHLLTLQGALRFDCSRSYFPEAHVGPTRILATRPYPAVWICRF